MKTIISDFDDTFYTDHYKKNIKLIKKFIKHDNKFVIATGRNINNLKKDLEYRKIDISYYICNDGGTIYDHKFNLLKNTIISKTSLIGLVKILQKSPYVDDIMLDANGIMVDDFKYQISTVIVKPNNKEEAYKLLQKITHKYNDIRGYLTYNWLILIPRDVSKKTAIKYLELIGNLNKESIYTIGDSENDKEMLEGYIGFKVGNKPFDINSTYKVSSFEEAMTIIKNL